MMLATFNLCMQPSKLAFDFQLFGCNFEIMHLLSTFHAIFDNLALTLQCYTQLSKISRTIAV